MPYAQNIFQAQHEPLTHGRHTALVKQPKEFYHSERYRVVRSQEFTHKFNVLSRIRKARRIQGSESFACGESVWISQQLSRSMPRHVEGVPSRRVLRIKQKLFCRLLDLPELSIQHLQPRRCFLAYVPRPL